ncbi:MAG: hypothetical protein Q8P41_04135 [Pseudomonadota bacterium]|nr:hypothetical protein [Pseudomonadota bacterium]
MILLLLALACSGDDAPVTAAPVPSGVADPAPNAGAAVTAPAAVAMPTVWTTQNIAQLVPVAPTRRTTVARPIPAAPKYDAVLQTLGTLVETWAGDPDNPWAIAHGLLARGTSFRLVDEREAVPHLFTAYAEPRPVGAHTLLGFPRSLGDVRVEPHTDLLLKNLGEIGVPPDATYPTRAGTVPVADLYRYTLLKTFLVPAKNQSSYEGPNDMPWGLQALAQWAPPGELQWIAEDGTPMDLDFLASFTVAVLTKESGFLFEAMQRGQGFTRQGQPLFSYSCGGAHLLQGASYAVARGYGTPKDRKAIEAQVPLMFYRLPIELAVYDDALKQNPKHKIRLLVQRMKFLGHFLETMGKMEAMGLYVPDEKQAQALEGAAQNLVLTVEALTKAGTFDNMETLRTKDEQLFLDVIGDACHAVRGLELELGRGTIAW